MSDDQSTAAAFATSWNTLPAGSVYTRAQFEEWLQPLTAGDVAGKRVLEMGCGNGSLLVHLAGWQPAYVEGIDLGEAVLSARRNMSLTGHPNWQVTQADLTSFRSPGFDLVYCIGVLHHLQNPKAGLDAVLANVAPGGRFHCWVYAREGNGLVIHLVEPLRRIFCRFPWWFTKYGVATPLALPFYLYAKLVAALGDGPLARKLPLASYCRWIAQREFAFFRHVAFDQLVTPQTTFIDRQTIEGWLQSYPQIREDSIYLLMRNGNSWKFGAQVR